MRQLNALIQFDERGRKLDQAAYGPEARKRNRDQIDAATPIIQNIYNVSPQGTVNVIQGDHNLVGHVGPNMHGDQAIDRIASQELNYVSTFLLACRRIVIAVDFTNLSAESASAIIT